MQFSRVRRMLVLAGSMLLFATAPAWANAISFVILDTSALSVQSSSYSIYFQLTDGSGDANNTVTLSNFSFGGGHAIAPAQLSGGASGDLSSAVTLSDTAFFNAVVQVFSPGSQLLFRLDLTANIDSGSVSDFFAMSVLDGNGSEIPTLDSSGLNTLLSVTFDSPLDIQTYATDSSTPTTNGDYITMGAPVLAPLAGPSSVPEPATFLLLGTSLAAVIVMSRRRI